MQHKAAEEGKEERATDAGEKGSSTATGRKGGDANERAKKDHPEAPGPVIGMNDERGGVSLSL